MPKHRQTAILPYAPEQMFDLVADVKRYPEFLPWVMGARVRRQSETLIVADLLVGFRMIRERYTSRVALDRPGRIELYHQQNGRGANWHLRVNGESSRHATIEAALKALERETT